mgnify:CR=1 FL=1
MKKALQNERVWDGATRIFHWLFAGSISMALIVGLTVDDDSLLFEWHMLAGLVAGFLLLVLHTLRFRENIALSMVTGRKRVAAGSGLKSPRPVLGLAVLAVSAAFIGQLLANYEKGAGHIELPWFQVMVPLDEDGFDTHGKAETGRHDEKDADDDHDD